MTLPSQRHLFEIPDAVAYLNCAYFSPNLRKIREVAEQELDVMAHPWTMAASGYFSRATRVRKLFAQLIGSASECVSIVASVSYGVATAVANCSIAAGQTIVLLEGQFPSNVYSWRELAKQTGAEIITVARPDDYDWTPRVLEAIDGRTAIVTIANCHWTDGSLIDLCQVRDRAQEVGAFFVVDATQSLGAHPLDVNKVQPDFLIAASYKWLMGPYGLALMYVDPKHHGGTPIEHNWTVRAGSEDFSRLVDYTDDFQPGAVRYDVGERGNFLLLPMLATALQQLVDWKVEQIAETLTQITGRIEDEARACGLEPVPAARRVGHMIGLRVPSGMPAGVAERFREENVFVSLRGDSIRVAPHLHNTESDVTRFLRVLKTEFA